MVVLVAQSLLQLLWLRLLLLLPLRTRPGPPAASSSASGATMMRRASPYAERANRSSLARPRSSKPPQSNASRQSNEAAQGLLPSAATCRCARAASSSRSRVA